MTQIRDCMTPQPESQLPSVAHKQEDPVTKVSKERFTSKLGLSDECCCMRAWRVVRDFFDSLITSITSLFHKIMGKKPQPHVEESEPVPTPPALDPILYVHHETFEEILNDFNACKKHYEVQLNELKSDIESLEIENEKHLTLMRNIHHELSNNHALFEDMLAVQKKGELILSLQQTSELHLLKRNYEEIEQQLSLKISEKAGKIYEILDEKQSQMESFGLDSAEVALIDLENYRDYYLCLCAYQKILDPQQKEHDSFLVKVDESMIAKRKEIAALKQYEKNVTKLKETQPKGLRNSGNSCYISSTLQALLASPCLRKKMKQDITQREGEQTIQFKERVVIHKALKNLIETMERSTSTQEEMQHKLAEFRQAVYNNRSLAPDLSLYGEYVQIEGKMVYKPDALKKPSPLKMQQDAGQLVMLLLEVIDFHIDQQEVWWGDNVQSEPLAEPNTMIEIGIPEGTQNYLQTLIEERFKLKDADPGQVVDVGGFKVEKKREKSRIVGDPEVLVVRLKRFGFKGTIGTKDCNEIALPSSLELDFSQAFDGEGNHKYKIVGCIKHTGSLSAGHYIANAVYENQWYSYNDLTSEMVTEIDPLLVRNEEQFQNYIFILERV